MHLPDAPSGETIDFLLSFDIPVLVMTARIDDELQESFESKDIVDYIVKDSLHSLEQIIRMAKRIWHNRSTKVLVVEDSRTYRAYTSNLLERQQLQVLEATDGCEAMEIFEKNPDIKVVLTDYIMPNMDGIELTKILRKTHNKDVLSIIVMSGVDDKKIPSKFLKLGANDFIYKPFSPEEFNTRLNSNFDLLELFEINKKRAERDYMTGLYNRRYFFEIGRKIFSSSKRRTTNIAVAMLDIDFFKKINDTYGHDIGDEAIKMLARILDERFRDADVVARIGGEEFAVMLVDTDGGNLFEIFEDLRKRVADAFLPLGREEDLKFTVSIGVSAKARDSVEEMLSDADRMLYEAKREGRNCIRTLES